MHYIVAVDDSDASRGAVRYAAKQAAAFDATLELVHVVEPEAELIEGEMVFPDGDKAMEIGERTLSRARDWTAEAVDDGDVGVETELLTGRPSDAIAGYASEVGADAIFVGHRGLSEEREQVVGSIAKSVLDKATVPVTIIK